MNMDKDKKKKKGFFSKAKEEIKAGLTQVVDDIHYIAGTKGGKEIEKSLDEKYPYRTKKYKNGGMVKDSSTGTTRGVGKARKQTYRIC
jgi:hypothetical protein